MAGRPRKPTKLKLLEGETRPSRLQTEPQPREARPQAPGWLAPEALRAWGRVTDELEAMGLLFAADTDALVAFCSSVAQFAEAERHLQEEGYVLDDGEGHVHRSPWNIVRRDALAAIARFGSSLGLTPVARAKLGTPQSLDEPGAAAAARLLS